MGISGVLSSAFTCCSRRPALSTISEPGTALVLPSSCVTSFKAHPQNVNCIGVCVHNVPEGEVRLATCSEALRVFTGCDDSSRWNATCEALTEGHERDVKTLAVCPDTGEIFTGSRDCAVACHAPTSPASDPGVPPPPPYALSYRLPSLHELVVTAVAITPPGSSSGNARLVTGSRDSQVKLIDLETRACVRANKIARNLVTGLCWVPKGSHTFVQSSEDKQIYIWDSRQLQPAVVLPRKQWIQTGCDVSPDGQLCLSTSIGFDGQGCEASIWDLRQNTLVNEYYAHSQTIHSGKFIPDSNMPEFVTVSGDSTVNRWSVAENCRPLDTKRPPTYSGLMSLAIGSNKEVYVGAVSGDVYVMRF